MILGLVPTIARMDSYATRGDQAFFIPRNEPVLHAGHDALGPLSREQLLAFESDGFLVLRDLFSEAEVAAVANEVERVATEVLAGDDRRLIREPGSNAVRSLFEFHAIPGLLGRLSRDSRLIAPARQILGSPVYVHQSRINRKPGFDGREFAWHSDFETWHAEDGMPRMRAVSISVALTPNETWNGPLMVIPGSHRVFASCVGKTPENHHETSLRRQEYGVPDQATLSLLVEKHGIDVFSGGPGTAFIFDCNLMHGSAGNMTPVPRTNAFVVFNSIENRLESPFHASVPRPEHVAVRKSTEGMDPVDGSLV